MRSPVLFAAALVALAGAVVVSPRPAEALSSGANPGFAGDVARGDGSPQTCNVCHSSYELNSGSGGVALDAPAAATQADVVRITVSVDNKTDPAPGSALRQGFQATVRDPATGELWGTLELADAVDTKFSSSGGGYVTHTTSGTGRTEWAFDWRPGSERAGVARVYAAGNAADGNGSTTGDHVYTTTADVLVSAVAADGGPEAGRLGTAHPNPARRGTAVRFDAAALGAATARVVDVRGRTVATVPVPAAGPLVVETAGLAPGVYAVVVDGAVRRTRALTVVR